MYRLMHGNLSLWSVIPNASSYGKSGRDETGSRRCESRHNILLHQCRCLFNDQVTISHQYTIHRALALKKTTEDRIRTAIQEAKFIDIRQGKRGTIDGVPVEKVEQQIKSSYQKIEQLISNYITLKNAILFSNAGIPKDTVVMRVGVQGKEYTMAELISTSDEIYGTRKHPDAFYSQLLTKMKRAYSDTITRINRQHDVVENDIRQYLERSTASDKGMSKEEIQQRSEMFHEDRDYVMVDPLNLKEKIQKLEAEIQAFRTDADATMSEQNALTVIDIDLTTVE